MLHCFVEQIYADIWKGCYTSASSSQKSGMLNPEDEGIMTIRYVGWLPNDITTQKASVFRVWESQTSQSTSTQVSMNSASQISYKLSPAGTPRLGILLLHITSCYYILSVGL